MEGKLLQALLAHYNSKIQSAEANLLVYFRNPGGIGEHPDVVGEMKKLVDEISLSKVSMDILNSMIQHKEEAVEGPPSASVAKE
jgi:hypothetical protein